MWPTWPEYPGTHSLQNLRQFGRNRVPYIDLYRQLRRAVCSPPGGELLYSSVVRPTLEYACPVWHTSITIAQSNKIELIQKRALSIIFGSFVFDEYDSFCVANNIQTLKDRRESLCKNFFNKSVLNVCGFLHHLISKPVNHEQLSILRNARQYYVPKTRTSRFQKSFIVHALLNYIWCVFLLFFMREP